MKTFNFPFHGNPAMTTEDPAPSIKLKGGFKFSSQPTEPIIRMFTLNIPVMSYDMLPSGQPDLEGTIDPRNNVIALWNFYVEHGTWKTFIYPHPFFGDITVKFDVPISIPEVQGNMGKVPTIEVKLLEHPA